jgi:glycosyltransferase involved in cell wall biosynthesis
MITKIDSIKYSTRSNELPLVSIGLPVYNGEDFIKDTLDSILQQTFDNFELIISDNASTDATEEICKSYILKDDRIKYHRNKKNLGAAKNYNQLVDMAKGKYFKWAAADDLIAPEYLALCVNILDNNLDILVCQTAVRLIDENNKHLQNYDDNLHFISESPYIRLRNYLFREVGMFNAVFGLIRIEQLRKTPLIGTYLGSDQVLLGELILRGKVNQISKRLFSRRKHLGQAGGAYVAYESGGKTKKATAAMAAWYDPENSKKKYTLSYNIQRFLSYISTVHRVPLKWHERILSYFYVIKWAFYNFLWVRIIRQAKKVKNNVFHNS